MSEISDPSSLATASSKPKKKSKRNVTETSGAEAKSNADKAYASTLQLPKTAFPIWTEPSIVKERFHERTTEELYKWQRENLPGTPFVLHDGPPYANGHLHAGHALNKILKDVILRYQILKGRKVDYVPGWDCHGLPVENKALETLKAEPHSLSAVAVRQAAKSTAQTAIRDQREEMMQFGLVGDWSVEGTYRHDGFESRQLRTFQSMVRKGMIYRRFRPVYWSPSSQTALAEAELQYEMHTSTAAYVSFSVVTDSLSGKLKELVGNKELKLVVWTTTPWTLPTNMAIAMHPDFEYTLLSRAERPHEILVVASTRLTALGHLLGPVASLAQVKGSAFAGAVYEPLFKDRDMVAPKRPIILGNDVLDDAGSGLVHMAPSHGHEDYQTLLSMGILNNNPLINIVDSQGRYTSDVESICGAEIGGRLAGLEVLFKGNKEVLAILEEAGVGNRLLGVERHRHRYPYDWRSKKPMIIKATAQWFANLEHVKGPALEALNGVNFYPTISKNRLQAFVKERSEWCISRQRVWGVPIPALHVIGTEDVILDDDSLGHILKVLEEKGTSYWWDGPVEEFMSPALSAKYGRQSLAKGTDTMDVWFDSGTSWTALSNRQADVYFEGSDQHRGWFQSSLLTYIASAENDKSPQAPFRNLITHGFVLDEKGRKMSKSLGNVISPMTVINGGSNPKAEPAYGADTLRLWAVSTQYSGDVAMSNAGLKQASELLRKLRITARYVLGSLQDRKKGDVMEMKDLSLLDRYVLHELWNLEKSAKTAYESFAFHEVIASLSHFVNVTLSSLYFDISKDVLYADPISSKARVTTLHVLNILNPVIAPLVPYLTEEIHATLAQQTEGQSNSFFATGWKEAPDTWKDEQTKVEMGQLLAVRKTVIDLLEKARSDKKLRSSLEADVTLIYPDPALEMPLVRLLHSQEGSLSSLFIVSESNLENDQAQVYAGEWAYSELVPIPDTDHYLRVCVKPARRLKCPRCWTFTREQESQVCARCEVALQAGPL